jgi:hypothetical protein
MTMAKFLYLYRGPATPMSEFTPEQSAAQMQAWESWGTKVGSALAQFGSPFGASTSVVDDGTTRTTYDLTGYSVIEAADLDEATSLLGGHPFLSEGKGRFSVEVFELLPM